MFMGVKLNNIFKLPLISTVIFLFTCTSLKFQQDISLYQDEIYKLESEIQRNPDNADAIRDLGVIYFQVSEYQKARDYLRRALQLNPENPKTLFYVGLSAEFDRENQLALSIYEKYTEMPRVSPYRKLMAGRYCWLSREITRDEIRKLKRDPSQVEIIPEAVAVFPLLFKRGDKKFSALGRGFSEMLIIDLGRIEDLRMVERIRIQAVLNELQLAKQPYMDPNSSPRHGKLLGAGKVIGGDFRIMPNEQLYINLSFWNVIEDHIPSISSKDDLLSNFFRVEKEMVLGLIKEMGIQLTQEQRDKIQLIPTENLEAYLAYCKGLEAEDGGRFNEALQYYQRAQEIDPNFQQSEFKSEEMDGLGTVSGNPEDALISAFEIDHIGPALPSVENLVSERLQSMGDNIGSNFVPGEDNRKPVEEAVQSAATPGFLPEPPEPPGNR
jgi:tetratricopeptide (TPR) repeat protein